MRLRAHGAWVVLTAFVASGAVAGLGISYLVRPLWQAKAVLRYSVAGVDDRTDYSSKLVTFVKEWRSDAFSSQSLEGLIDDPRLDLYRDERGRMPLESVEDIMRNHLSMNVLALPETTRHNTVVFTVGFVYPDARKAMETTKALTARLIQASFEKRLSRMAGVKMAPDKSSIQEQVGVVDQAVMPQRPIIPNRANFIVAGAISGAILAMGASTVRRRMFPPGPGLQHA